jgi:RNA polymerase sigma-70 factor (ECF subfamily)
VKTRPQDCPKEELGKLGKEIECFLRKRYRDFEACRDIAQESLLRLWRKEAAGGVVNNRRAWVYRAARNLLIDEFRKNLPNQLGLEVQEKITILPTQKKEWSTDEPRWTLGEEEFYRSEVVGLLPHAYEQLPLSEQLYLDSKFVGGMRCCEIAELEGITTSHARVRLFRARRRLRGLLSTAAEQKLKEKEETKECS